MFTFDCIKNINSTTHYRVIPSAPRLVGIELNPGPTTTTSAQSLFADGVRLILSFLSIRDFINSSQTCQNWIQSASSTTSMRQSSHHSIRCASRTFRRIGSRSNYTTTVCDIPESTSSKFSLLQCITEFDPSYVITYDELFVQRATSLSRLSGLHKLILRLEMPNDNNGIILKNNNKFDRVELPSIVLPHRLRYLELHFGERGNYSYLRQNQLLQTIGSLNELQTLIMKELPSSRGLFNYPFDYSPLMHLSSLIHLDLPLLGSSSVNTTKPHVKVALEAIRTLSSHLEYLSLSSSSESYTFDQTIIQQICDHQIGMPQMRVFNTSNTVLAKPFLDAIYQCMPNLHMFERGQSRVWIRHLDALIPFRQLESLEFDHKPNLSSHIELEATETELVNVFIQLSPHLTAFRFNSWHLQDDRKLSHLLLGLPSLNRITLESIALPGIYYFTPISAQQIIHLEVKITDLSQYPDFFTVILGKFINLINFKCGIGQSPLLAPPTNWTHIYQLFDSRIYLPQLRQLDLRTDAIDVIFSYHEELTETNSNERRVLMNRVVFPKRTKDQSRMHREMKDVQSRLFHDLNHGHSITPPTSRLVGVELNPGPTSATSSNATMTPQEFFSDGLHSIMLFLNNREYVASASTCHSWFQAASTLRGHTQLKGTLNASLKSLATEIWRVYTLLSHVTHLSSSCADFDFHFIVHPSFFAAHFPHLLFLNIFIENMYQPNNDDSEPELPISDMTLPPHLTELIIEIYNSTCACLRLERENTLWKAISNLHELKKFHYIRGNASSIWYDYSFDFSHLARMQSLTELKLNINLEESDFDHPLPDHILVACHSIRTLPLLSHLNFLTLMTSSVLTELGHLPQMRFLSIEYQHDYSYPFLRSLHLAMPNLTQIDFDGRANLLTEFDLDGFALFQQLETFTCLLEPRISTHAEVSEVETVQHLIQCKNLTHISFNHWVVEYATNWSHLFTGLTHLTSLSFNFSSTYSLKDLIHPDACQQLLKLKAVISRNNHHQLIHQFIESLARFTMLRELDLEIIGNQPTKSEEWVKVYELLNSNHFFPHLSVIHIKCTGERSASFRYDQSEFVNCVVFPEQTEQQKRLHRTPYQPPRERLVGIELNPPLTGVCT